MKKNIATEIEELVLPITDANNLELVDVEYVKEGSTWFLRVVIDKNGIIDVEDCVTVSNIINPIIDANDPIKENYILDVCSKEKGCE